MGGSISLENNPLECDDFERFVWLLQKQNELKNRLTAFCKNGTSLWELNIDTIGTTPSTTLSTDSSSGSTTLSTDSSSGSTTLSTDSSSESTAQTTPKPSSSAKIEYPTIVSLIGTTLMAINFLKII
jgi:hypothetical protein